MTQHNRHIVHFRSISALASAGVLMAALIFSPTAHGGARPHQNFRAPMQCAALDAGTPAYRDCMVRYDTAPTGTLAVDTPLRAKPDPYDPPTGTLAKGTEVIVFERAANGFWLYVRSGNLEGYVPFEVLN